VVPVASAAVAPQPAVVPVAASVLVAVP